MTRLSSGRGDSTSLLTVKRNTKNHEPTNPPRIVWSLPAARSALKSCITLKVRTQRRRAMPADVVLGRAGDKSGKRNRLNAWHTPQHTAVRFVLTHCVAPRGDVLMSMRSSTLQSTHVVVVLRVGESIELSDSLAFTLKKKMTKTQQQGPAKSSVSYWNSFINVYTLITFVIFVLRRKRRWRALMLGYSW